LSELGCLVLAAIQAGEDGGNSLSPAVAALVDGQRPEAAHIETIVELRAADDAVILIGQVGMRHPQFSALRLLTAELTRLTGANLGYIPEGANSAGICLAGALPHRGIGGQPVAAPGANAGEMISRPNRAMVLLGIEPDLDCSDGEAALEAMNRAEFILALSPFLGESLKEHADVVLPMGTFAETSGTFVNAAGDWQSFGGVAESFGDSRPGWKILRVLGNLLGVPDCEYESSEEVRDELRALLGDVAASNEISLNQPVAGSAEADGTVAQDIPMYGIDALVRRSGPLQDTAEAKNAFADADNARKIA
jgi:NADH-quinone oxidoreductase subunit G